MIHPPAYPDVYLNYLDCYWTIIAPLGLRLKLHSFSYEIEDGGTTCYYDYFKIYEEENDNNMASKICGNGDHEHVVSEGTTLRLYFHSDGIVQRKGFKTKFALLGKL